MSTAPVSPRLLVGLGNPGPAYAATRHNVGFRLVDAILARLPGSGPGEPRHHADSQIWECRFAGRQLYLQKPLTWMNLSGKAVAKLARELELTPAEILVMYDDLDLPLGTLRLRSGGSAGGHNGVASLIECLGSQDFPRLRIGIGGEDRGEAVEYVLAAFAPAEEALLLAVLRQAREAALLAVRRGVGTAMNAYNGKVCDAEAPQDRTQEPGS